MGNLLDINSDIHALSPLSLAFVGDSVYDLLVRQYLVSLANRPVKELNSMKVTLVNCKSQAQSAKAIFDILSEEETDIYKRGRNVKVNTASKHSTLADYHSATGLEALFGYLYLSGRTDRIRELFNKIIETVEV